MNLIIDWFRRQFSNPQIVFLSLFLLGLLLVISYAGNTLAPVLAGIVIAYLLEGLIARLTRMSIPRFVALWLVFLGFIFFLTSLTFGLLPILYNQLTEFVQQIPSILTRGQAVLMTLPERYPELVTFVRVEEVIDNLRTQLTAFGQSLVASTITGAASVITILIYVILLPILVFFFLKDKELILGWFKRLMPQNRELAARVWGDVDAQIANYIRGKFWEILIVWVVTLVAFSILGIQFALLLSFLVGISVLIPYVGAAVVTIPVAIIAWFQWGWSTDFATLVIVYLVIQMLDGNLLVPLLFSEVVNIHPVAIIVAVLVFGGIWGIWGIIFAIPLATLVQSVIMAWPQAPAEEEANSR